MSANLTAVLQQLLQNTSNLRALQQLMTPDATYVSLNFDNPELKKIEPWAGIHKGRRPYLMSLRQSNASGKHSISRSPTLLSRVFVSPCSPFLRTDRTRPGRKSHRHSAFWRASRGDKVAYLQFLEDSYGTAGSFKTGGATRFHSDPSGREFEV